MCSFDNFEWHSDTDYLFLRNNVPDFHRLKSNLAPKNGVYIYICTKMCTSVCVHCTSILNFNVYWYMCTGICEQVHVYMYYIHVHVYVKPFYITVFLCEVIVNKLWEVCV